MSDSAKNTVVGSSGFGEFEETLRLIASLPAPEGIEERVQARLDVMPHAGSLTTSASARILRWPVALSPANGWMQSSLARAAAAAAIVAVVIGGGWGVYSHVQPAQSARSTTVLPHSAGQGGFSSAGAMRTPQTLNRPVVINLEAAPSVTVAPQPVKPAVKPAPKTPPDQAKPDADSETAAQPKAPATE
ncbi:MAG: hypothetical protein ABSF70_01760 [Terracidiphilus sp.]|jgi:hypothetical protein